MEPKSSEHIPTPIEYTPQAPRPAGEQSPDIPPAQESYEQHEVAVEKAGEQVRQVTQATTSTVVQLPTPVQTTTTDESVSTDNDTPATAGDDHVIEKEWVDKAKRVIAETKEDPHKRERAVNKLQVDYLKKRYGKELGSDAA